MHVLIFFINTGILMKSVTMLHVTCNIVTDSINIPVLMQKTSTCMYMHMYITYDKYMYMCDLLLSTTVNQL